MSAQVRYVGVSASELRRIAALRPRTDVEVEPVVTLQAKPRGLPRCVVAGCDTMLAPEIAAMQQGMCQSHLRDKRRREEGR